MLALLSILIIVFQNIVPSGNQNILYDSTIFLKANYDLLDTNYAAIPFEKISTDTTLKYYRLEDYAKLSKAGKKYWLRFKIKNYSNQSFVCFGLRYFNGNLYTPNNTTNCYNKIQINKKDYFWNRYFFSNDVILPIPFSKKNSTYYLEITSSVASGLGFLFAQTQFIHNKSIVNFIFYCVCACTIFVALLFSLILLIKLKDKLYMYYSLYILSVLIYCLTSWSFLTPFFNITRNNFYIECIPFAAITIFLILYIREFFNTKIYFPLLDKVILASVFMRPIIFFVGYYFDIQILHQTIVDILLLLPTFYAAILTYRLKIKPTKYCLISFAIIYLGFFLHATFDFYSINFIKNSFGYYFEESGIFFCFFTITEVIFFTLSLTQRIVGLRKKKEIEQTKTIDYQEQIIKKNKENILLKEKQNLLLEDLVLQRTNEVNLANTKLLEQERHINKMLNESNIKLNQDLEMLQKVRLMKTNVNYTEFIQTFANEDTCLAFISELKWKNDFECKKCKFKRYNKINNSFARKCKLCKYEESATAHTLLTNIKFPLQKALYLVYVSYTFKDFNINKISDELMLRTATSYGFIKKIKMRIDNHKQTKLEIQSWTSILIDDH